MKVRGKNYRAVWMEGRDVVVINQPLLPHKFALLRLKNHRQTAAAITTMIIRGAGTIGATAGYGMAQAYLEGVDLDKAYRTLLHTRPTAADLKHALDRVRANARTPAEAVAGAEEIADEYVARMQAIARAGLPLIKNGCRVLTHCNAGWLALVDWGSAPAPIYLAKRKGRKVFVWVDETRPRNQGANFTSWEFMQERIPHKVIADNAGGHYMRHGEVDLCIVGADRIAANGDAANKIGTYTKAVLAKENGIPFYVAAPSSTIDLKCKTGADIPIEERDEDEVHYVGRERITPVGARAGNPAFDVTPAKYITGIITERGIVKPSQIREGIQPMTGVDAVIFDLGNVLISVNEQRSIERFAERTGKTTAEIQAYFLTTSHATELSLGKMTKRQFHRIVSTECGFTGDYEEFALIWSDIFAPITPMIELAQSLATRRPRLILSNTNIIHADFFLERYPWINEFDAVILSHEVGLLKPDAAIYELAVKQTGLAADRVVFIDDLNANVQGAKAAGLQAFQHQSPEQTRVELTKLGVLSI